jgi:hypothetical protein
MRYLKLYEQFRLNESSDWKQTLEINGKEYKINWGMPNLELAEIFQTLNHHKSNLPKEWSDSFGVIFNSSRPPEFSHQTDPSEEFINKPLEPSMKGQATPSNPEIKYSCYELLQLDSIGGKSGDDLVPYYLGFNGSIKKTDNNSYISKGVYKWIDNETLEITELPIGTWTEDYKEFLENMITNGLNNLNRTTPPRIGLTLIVTVLIIFLKDL